VRGREFTAARMADAYERLYAGMLADIGAPARSPACAS
jgi:hypothetical protein